ncbi:dephospho-CoA kinase [Candidatus Sumerlaeota bacterium]|nr:dephospho-CoA kinase [Candidatus Sumerlaeota bacterium]
MFILGLTGSFGAGKSTVSQMLAERGALISDADAHAKHAVRKGTKALRELKKLMGPEVMLPDGTLDRKAVRERIFEDEALRKAVEAIIHPAVKKLRDKEVKQARKDGVEIIVLDIPLLFENGLEQEADKVAAVVCDETQIILRLQARDGFSEAEIRQRWAAQISQEDKCGLADCVIDNSKSLEETALQVDALLHRIREGNWRKDPD